MQQDIIDIVNDIRANKGLGPVAEVSPEIRLREDLELDSLDLAELTARIESRTGVDIFATDVVTTVGEVLSKLE